MAELQLIRAGFSICGRECTLSGICVCSLAGNVCAHMHVMTYSVFKITLQHAHTEV